jgi:hypothetical protein
MVPRSWWFSCLMVLVPLGCSAGMVSVSFDTLTPSSPYSRALYATMHLIDDLTGADQVDNESGTIAHRLMMVEAALDHLNSLSQSAQISYADMHYLAMLVTKVRLLVAHTLA